MLQIIIIRTNLNKLTQTTEGPTASPTTRTFTLAHHFQEGVASNCPNLGCETLSGGLHECDARCRETENCNLINFCPAGADCTSGLNRCCMRSCESDDLQTVTTWRGWDVYILETDDAFVHENGHEVIDASTVCPTTAVIETQEPTSSPSNTPTNAPTNAPTNTPSNAPTNTPSNAPTNAPSNAPTNAPTNSPSNAPSHMPTLHPCLTDQHDCDKTAGGVCNQLSGNDYSCGCTEGYECTAGCAEESDDEVEFAPPSDDSHGPSDEDKFAPPSDDNHGSSDEEDSGPPQDLGRRLLAHRASDSMTKVGDGCCRFPGWTAQVLNSPWFLAFSL